VSTQGVILIDLLALGLVFVILNLVRTQQLHVAHGALWLMAVAGLIVIVSVPALRGFITTAVGAEYPASAVSLLAFVFIFVVLIFFSSQLSTLAARQVKLAQALAVKELMAESQQAAAGALPDAQAGAAGQAPWHEQPAPVTAAASLSTAGHAPDAAAASAAGHTPDAATASAAGPTTAGLAAPAAPAAASAASAGGRQSAATHSTNRAAAAETSDAAANGGQPDAATAGTNGAAAHTHAPAAVEANG
jgi:hypothetical protein